MKVATYFAWLCKLKTVGVRISEDGSFKRQLLSFGFAGTILFNLTVLVSFAYLMISGTAKFEFNTIVPHGMIFYYSTIVLVNPVISTNIFLSGKNIDLVGDAEMSWVNVLTSGAISLPLAVAFGLGSLPFFGTTLYGRFLFGSQMFLVTWNVFLFMNTGTGMIQGFKKGCLQKIGKKMDPLEIEIVCEKYTRMKECLGIYSLMSIVFSQSMLIASIYTVLVSLELACIILSFSLIAQLANVIVNIEYVYQEIAMILSRGRRLARQSSPRTKEQLNEALDDLEASGPLTGKGEHRILSLRWEKGAGMKIFHKGFKKCFGGLYLPPPSRQIMENSEREKRILVKIYEK